MGRVSAKRQHDTQQRITVVFGYGLFLFTIIALLINFVPWGGVLINPETLHWNVLATMLAFAFAAIFPPLAGYFVGDASTRTKSKLVHHYNGVLFAILGYWLTVIISTGMAFVNLSDITYDIPQYIVGSVVPVVVSVLVLVFLGIFYARHTNHQVSLINYLPYRVVLISTVASLFIISGISIAFGTWYGADLLSSFAVLFLPTVMIAVLVAFGAWVIGKRNGKVGERLIKSLLALSYAFIAMTFLTQVLWLNPALASWSIVVGLIVWVIYIYLLRRFASTEKA